MTVEGNFDLAWKAQLAITVRQVCERSIGHGWIQLLYKRFVGPVNPSSHERSQQTPDEPASDPVLETIGCLYGLLLADTRNVASLASDGQAF